LIEMERKEEHKNVHMITSKERDEQPKVATVMCGGMRTRVDAMNQGNRSTSG
jgi:hypothetical protein